MVTFTRIAASVSLVAALTACGSSNGTSTTPSTTRTILSQGSFQTASAPAGTRDLTGTDVALFPVTLTAGGTLDVTASWAAQTNDVEFAIHQGTCTFSNLGTTACVSVMESGKPTTKGATIAKVLAAGNYTILIVNYGPGSESGTYQVGFTP